MDKFVKPPETNYADHLPHFPTREDLIGLGVNEIFANALMPETIAALYEIIKDNPNFVMNRTLWALTSFGVTLDLKSLGNALGLRVNKGVRVPFDSHDYVFRRGKARSDSVIDGPACKSEIVISTSGNCKTTKKALYTLRLEPGLKKMLFDESNNRIKNLHDRQRLLKAQKWYKIADNTHNLCDYFFAGKEAYEALKKCSDADGEQVFNAVMQETFIPPTNERNVAKQEAPDTLTTAEEQPVEPQPPVVATLEEPEVVHAELEEDFDKWLSSVVTDTDYIAETLF